MLGVGDESKIWANLGPKIRSILLFLVCRRMCGCLPSSVLLDVVDWVGAALSLEDCFTCSFFVGPALSKEEVVSLLTWSFVMMMSWAPLALVAAIHYYDDCSTLLLYSISCLRAFSASLIKCGLRQGIGLAMGGKAAKGGGEPSWQGCCCLGKTVVMTVF